MRQRAPMSRELADLIARSIGDSLTHADAFNFPTGYVPAGAFRRDLEAVDAAPAKARDVRSNLLATMCEAVGMYLAHAIDHVRALENDLRRDPVPIWSTLTLCLAVQESTVWMSHLLDPSISTAQRLCRVAAQWFDDSRLARASAATFGAEHAADVQMYHGFKLSELEAGGFTVEQSDRGRPIRVRLDQNSALLELSLTDAVTRMMPDGAPSPYRLSSGAAHGRPWMLERSATKAADGQLLGEGSTAATAAFTVMFCMEAWVPAWGGYFGLDVSDQLVAINEARQVLGCEGSDLR